MPSGRDGIPLAGAGSTGSRHIMGMRIWGRLSSSGAKLPLLAATLLCLQLAGCASASNGKAVSEGASHLPPTPHFFLGWFTQESEPSSTLRQYRRDGVNLMIAYRRPGETRRWVRAALRNGIRVLLQPNPGWIEHGDLKALQAFVRTYQHEPAVYGWYLYDEPDFNGLKPSALIAAYRALKAIDPAPVAVTFATDHCTFGREGIDPRYLAGFDLLLFVRYPFYVNLRDNPVTDARTVDQNCVETARTRRKLGPIMVEQGFGRGQRDGPFMWRDPTCAESDRLAQLAVTAGVKGILFYSDTQADASVRRNIERLIAAWDKTESSSPQASPQPGTPGSACR